eukprot:2077511-Amphidinium_carterae.1
MRVLEDVSWAPRKQAADCPSAGRSALDHFEAQRVFMVLPFCEEAERRRTWTAATEICGRVQSIQFVGTTPSVQVFKDAASLKTIHGLQSNSSGERERESGSEQKFYFRAR